MDWGWIIIFGLAIVGAALIAGGVVAYRGTTRSAPKVLGAMGIAAGVVMWVVVATAMPVSNTSTASHTPQIELQTSTQ